MEDFSILDIKSVYEPPYILDFFEYLICPVCETEIYVFKTLIDESSFFICENCEHTIRFNFVKI